MVAWTIASATTVLPFPHGSSERAAGAGPACGSPPPGEVPPGLSAGGADAPCGEPQMQCWLLASDTAAREEDLPALHRARPQLSGGTSQCPKLRGGDGI